MKARKKPAAKRKGNKAAEQRLNQIDERFSQMADGAAAMPNIPADEMANLVHDRLANELHTQLLKVRRMKNQIRKADPMSMKTQELAFHLPNEVKMYFILLARYVDYLDRQEV